MGDIYSRHYETMLKIIERLEAICNGDPWKIRIALKIFIEELQAKVEEHKKETQV